MTTNIGRNFCLAPYTQITYSPWGSFSPCPEIGGDLSSDEKSIVKLWNGSDLKKLRQEFSNNQQSKICNRCWDQEEVGNSSLRKRLFGYKHLKDDILNFIQKDYIAGPRQINLMVSNICNLRCRICNAGLSVTYNKEGESYEKQFNIVDTRYVTPNKKKHAFSDDQIEEIFKLSNNLIRLEMYGGEPLLDKPTLLLLEKLVNSGQSKNITVFYNTNGTVKPTQRHYDLWKEFKQIEFNFSFDDFGKRFTYQRYPADWNEVLENFNELKNYSWQVPVQFQIILTLSVFNVYYIDDILNEFKKFELPVFLNTLHDPDYYDIRYLPKQIKQQIYDHLDPTSEKTTFVRNMLMQQTDIDEWDNFKFWTNAKDQYRNEKFATTFSKFYQLLHNYDHTF